MERLQKYMARTGIASRRGSEEIIAQGRVKVNGKLVTTPGFTIDPLKDRVEVDKLSLRGPEQKVYLLMNKPVGYVSTINDPQGRRKITDLIKGVQQRVYPVGRLDYDSEGLLLLTNDGELTFALTHPKHEVPRTYQLLVSGIPESSKLSQLAKGIPLKEGMTAPAKVKVLEKRSDSVVLQITIHEGRNRQVRRMCEYIGHPVLALRRISMGPLQLGDLKRGRFRYLSAREIKLLKQAVYPEQAKRN